MAENPTQETAVTEKPTVHPEPEVKENLLGQYLSLDENLVRFNARIIDSMDIERNKLINDIRNDLNN